MASVRETRVSRFATTRWSLILEASAQEADGSPERARPALDVICRAYRQPVLVYIRHHGYPVQDAEDMTQAFFTHFLEHHLHAHADPARGRFRVFLLTALRNFLADARAEAQALKRGGGNIRIGLADGELENSSDPDESPEYCFARTWAVTVIERASKRLTDEARAAGRGALFAQLSAFLAEPPDATDYARLAVEFGLRPNTLAVMVHRLRRRLRELVHEELAQTVSDPAALAQELHDLRDVLAHHA